MICPKCGHAASGNFCNNCGAPLTMKNTNEKDDRSYFLDDLVGLDDPVGLDNLIDLEDLINLDYLVDPEEPGRPDSSQHMPEEPDWLDDPGEETDWQEFSLESTKRTVTTGQAPFRYHKEAADKPAAAKKQKEKKPENKEPQKKGPDKREPDRRELQKKEMQRKELEKKAPGKKELRNKEIRNEELRNKEIQEISGLREKPLRKEPRRRTAQNRVYQSGDPQNISSLSSLKNKLGGRRSGQEPERLDLYRQNRNLQETGAAMEGYGRSDSSRDHGVSLEERSDSGFMDKMVKGLMGVVVLISRLMQLVSVLLMASMAATLAWSFWKNREGLGSVRMIAAEENYGLALYLAFAGTALFMEFIWCFWILSRKAAGGNIRLKKYDTGRGFFPFLICAALIYLAEPARAWLPSVMEQWKGLNEGAQAALNAVVIHKEQLLFSSVLGAALSLIRKILSV